MWTHIAQPLSKKITMQHPSHHMFSSVAATVSCEATRVNTMNPSKTSSIFFSSVQFKFYKWKDDDQQSPSILSSCKYINRSTKVLHESVPKTIDYDATSQQHAGDKSGCTTTTSCHHYHSGVNMLSAVDGSIFMDGTVIKPPAFTAIFALLAVMITTIVHVRNNPFSFTYSSGRSRGRRSPSTLKFTTVHVALILGTMATYVVHGYDCLAGFYYTTSYCSQCPAGRYSDTPNLASCKYCSKGRVSSGTGATSCPTACGAFKKIHILFLGFKPNLTHIFPFKLLKLLHFLHFFSARILRKSGKWWKSSILW